MKPLLSLLAVGVTLCHAAETNFFISPGSQADQLASGNETDLYPVYQEHHDTLFSWNTNWTLISLLLYQNENASYIRLLSFEENPSNTYTYNMTPEVDLTWNDVFFLTFWNENWDTEGGERFFSSSYFRINASDPDSTTTTTTTTTTSTSTATSTSTSTSTSTTSPPPTDSSADSSQTTSSSTSSDSNSSDLSSSAKVGLGVGIGLGIPALALAAVAIFYYRRRSQAAAEQRQQQQQGGQFPPSLPSAGPYGPGGAGAGAGYPSSPPVSEMYNPSPFKLGAANTVPGYMGPSEVEGSGVSSLGGTHYSGFQELPAR
ncbi:hypothetical protein BDW59DRAFT_153374 [Aspergillus cavernicola]|uniref:Mid2 domain-containing protein n=1 Tax=Aspergillus cavernicola TaxID=176166 RepID=A0ABR4HL74_9EURO